jgi:predicted DNA-binding transcriptional regulator AlpA
VDWFSVLWIESAQREVSELKMGKGNHLSATREASDVSLDVKYGKFISAGEIAAQLHVSKMTAFRLMKRENVTRAYFGVGKNGTVRFPRNEVEAVIARRSVKPNQQR